MHICSHVQNVGFFGFWVGSNWRHLSLTVRWCGVDVYFGAIDIGLKDVCESHERPRRALSMPAEMRINILQKYFFNEDIYVFLLNYILYVCPNSRAKRNLNLSSFKKTSKLSTPLHHIHHHHNLSICCFSILLDRDWYFSSSRYNKNNDTNIILKNQLLSSMQ